MKKYTINVEDVLNLNEEEKQKPLTFEKLIGAEIMINANLVKPEGGTKKITLSDLCDIVENGFKTIHEEIAVIKQEIVDIKQDVNDKFDELKQEIAKLKEDNNLK